MRRILQQLTGSPKKGWPSSDKLMDVWAACHPLIDTLNTSERYISVS